MNPRPNTHKNAHIYFHYTQKAVPLQPRTSCPARCLVKKAGKHDTVGLFLKKAADKEEKMKPPKTIWSFCGLLFGQMGGIFTLIGLFFRIADVPARGGAGLVLYPFWCSSLSGGAGLLLEKSSVGEAGAISKKGRTFGQRAGLRCPTFGLDQLEHGVIPESIWAICALGRAVHLLPSRSDVYGKKRAFLAETL